MKKKLNICFLIVWMIVIFLLSSQDSNKSQNLSDGLIYKSVDVVATVTKQDIPEVRKIEIVHSASSTVRTIAHFIEYLILGLLAINVLKDYCKLNYKIMLAGIAFCFVYAITDEMHQLFVSGRAFQFIDLLVDLIGSSLGSFTYLKLKKDK